MQELRLVMIVIGAIAIVALLIHGMWTSKKERPAKFSERPIQKVVEEKDEEGFDQDGIGSVRVVKASKNDTQKDQNEQNYPAEDPLFSEPKTVSKHEAVNNAIKQAATQEASEKMKKAKDFYHFEDTEEDIALAEEEETLRQNQEQNPEQQEQEQAKEDAIETQEVLVFNVQAPAHQMFRGEELLSSLEQYGMQFGEMNIFHRHADDESKKVIFSAANMLNPGSFPISAIHQFTTPGVTFFMALPCYGEAEQNFKLMLKTAQLVADQLGGHVTDDGRNLLTPTKLDECRDIVKQYTVPA